MGQVHAENREPKRVAERMFGEPFGAHAVVEDLVGVAAGLRAHLPIPCRGAVVSAQAVPILSGALPCHREFRAAYER